MQESINKKVKIYLDFYLILPLSVKLKMVRIPTRFLIHPSEGWIKIWFDFITKLHVKGPFPWSFVIKSNQIFFIYLMNSANWFGLCGSLPPSIIKFLCPVAPKVPFWSCLRNIRWFIFYIEKVQIFLHSYDRVPLIMNQSQIGPT